MALGAGWTSRAKTCSGSRSAELGALRVFVRELSEDAPEVFGPLPRKRERSLRLTAGVLLQSPSCIGVWGCPDVDRCAPRDVLVRSGSLVLVLEKDARVSGTLRAACDPQAQECPPVP
jgi:hypothetical protein